MGVHHGNRPTGNDRMVPKLLNHYYGADPAAAYSLRNLDYLKRNDPVVRARRASDNEERDFTAEEVNSGGIENWSQALLTPGSYDASRDVGYFGEVSSSDLISGDDLATELSLTAGTAHNSDAGWLKFYVGPNAFCNRQGNAYILYVAKRTMRYDLSWNDINSAGGVDGTTEVEINGQSYSVRLMQGADADPSTYTFVTNCTDNPGENSEWNELFYRVSEKIPDCADPTEGMEGGSSTTRHGGPQNGSNWANFTNSELNVQVGNGRAAWCQEVDGPDPSRRVDRGNTGVAGFSTGTASNAITLFGWRPCLQINLGQSTGDVSAFVTTWYDQSGNDNHATQTTATNQPKIVDAGTLVTENGKAAMDFDGVDDYFDRITTSLDLRSFITVAGSASGGGGQIFGSLGGGGVGVTSYGSFTGNFTNESIYYFIGPSSADALATDYNLQNNEQFLNFTIFDENNSAIFVNSNSANLIGSQNTVFTLDYQIGKRIDREEYFGKYIQEIIFYPSDQSANRTAIESNINSYYDIY